MSARRSHTKSRKGCQDCKRRKVKCDECLPSCFNCTRRGVICSFFGPASSSTSPFSDGGDRRTPQSNHDGDINLTRFERLPRSLPTSTAEVHCRDLELMHHYCFVTCKTLAYQADMQHVWGVIIPEIGYESPFLMHGILAVAAMHKAHLLVARRREYANLAIYHQTAGLEGFRAALSNLNREDWKPCFCFASMVALGMCGQSSLGKVDGAALVEAADGVSGVLDLFVFIRGIRTVLQPYQAQIMGTPLAPLTQGSWCTEADESTFNASLLQFSLLPGDVFEALDETANFYRRTLDEGTLKGYLAAIRELRKSAVLMASGGTQPEVSTVMIVPYTIDDSVLMDILSNRPHAMVLLAHIAVYLRALETRFWLFTGLAKRMFEVVDKGLARLPLHLDMVIWSRKHVFETYET